MRKNTKKKPQQKSVIETTVSICFDLMMAASFVIISITMYNIVTLMMKYGK
jgi:L-cystine uptake protein TcyP (sodium:dicarboxylate symporter family)